MSNTTFSEKAFDNYLQKILSEECFLPQPTIQEILEKYRHHFVYAFTDSSVNPNIRENYEGYEFHGDGIVNATTKCYVYKEFRHKAEKIGELSELENNLRSKSVLAGFSTILGMPQYARIDNESYFTSKKRAKNKMSLAEDIFEAFVGALAFVLDEMHPDLYNYGHNVASTFVLKQIKTRISNDTMQLGHENTAKKRTLLKELFQKAHFGEIKYIILQKPVKALQINQEFILTIEFCAEIQYCIDKIANGKGSRYFGIATNFVLDLAKESLARDLLDYLWRSFKINTDFINTYKIELAESVHRGETLYKLVDKSKSFLPPPIPPKYTAMLPPPSAIPLQQPPSLTLLDEEPPRKTAKMDLLYLDCNAFYDNFFSEPSLVEFDPKNYNILFRPDPETKSTIAINDYFL